MGETATCKHCCESFEGNQLKAPNVCYRCFEERMGPVIRRFQRTVAREGIQSGLVQAHGDLLRVGFTQEAAVDFLATAMLEAHRPERGAAGDQG